MNTIDNKILESANLGPAPEPKKDTLGQSEFLKLMTTQLNNQDPLKPMESGEFFTQIAQFSSVAGIQELQQSFQQVAAAMYSSQALQASAMVGRQVVIPSSVIDLRAGEIAQGTVELPTSTTNLVLNVADGNGQLIRRINLGQQAAGDVRFSWDGASDNEEPMAPGRYQINAQAMIGGEPTSLQTYIAAKVDSVTMGSKGQGISLNLSGLGAIALSNVKKVM